MTATIGYHVSDFQERLQAALGDGYRLERELDGAGMSRVFVAREQALQRTVVIKVLPPELAAGVNVDRFRREIQLAAQLQHPHIVPLLAAGEEDGLLWFSMPFIEGESLRHALANRGQLSPRDVVRILHDVVDALAYAHARGIVHRDIKPGNILTQGMHALVTDFGVAKALSEAIPLHGGGTTSGMAIGTPAYMAPEQLAADPAADHRVDLYAVGLLAYELLTGKSPFSGASPQATLAAQLTYVPPAPHTLSGDIPPALSAIIMRCLEKQASKRHDTAKALLADLEALPPMTGSTPSTRRVGGSTRTRAILAGAVVLGVAAWAMTSDTRRGSAPLTGADTLDARDAGPGGSRTRGTVGRTPAVRDADSVRVAVETIPVFREVGDAAAGTTLPLVMTRAESLAIAEAVLKRQATQKTEQAAGAAGATDTKAAPPSSTTPTGTRVFVQATDGALTQVNREQIIAEVSRIFSDSMARALKEAQAALAQAPRMVRFGPPGGEGGFPAPPLPPANASGASSITIAPTGPGGSGSDRSAGSTPRFSLMLAPPADGRLRVIVVPFQNATGKREYIGASRDIANVLRSAIPADKFDVVPGEVSDRLSRSAPDRMSIAWSMRADYLITGMVTTRADSVVYLMQWEDVRTGRFTRVAEAAAPVADAKRAYEAGKAQVAAWLDTAATIAARRRSGQPGERRY